MVIEFRLETFNDDNYNDNDDLNIMIGNQQNNCTFLRNRTHSHISFTFLLSMVTSILIDPFAEFGSNLDWKLK